MRCRQLAIAAVAMSGMSLLMQACASDDEGAAGTVVDFDGVQVESPAINGRSVKVVRGSGNVAIQDVPIADVHALSLRSIGDVHVVVGETESLQIQAEDNILPLLTAHVVNGKLQLSTKTGSSISATKPILYTVTLKQLNAVEVSASGNVTLQGLRDDLLSLSLTGSGDIHAAGRCARLQVNLNGSGDLDAANCSASDAEISITGSGGVKVAASTRLKAIVVGSGDLDATSTSTDEADLAITGSGNANIKVSARLKATIAGSGSIVYSGNPVVEQRVSGSGSINKR
jgi:hypothetical protein